MKLSEIEISQNCPTLGVSNGHCSCLQQPVDPHSPHNCWVSSTVAVSAPVLMPSNTLLKFTSPCSKVGKDTSARSALPPLWALRSSLAGLNRFGQWTGGISEYWFKMVQVCSSSEHLTKISIKSSDCTDILTRHDQAWPGKTRNMENKHPFKSSTGWADHFSKTESEHYNKPKASKA